MRDKIWLKESFACAARAREAGFVNIEKEILPNGDGLIYAIKT